MCWFNFVVIFEGAIITIITVHVIVLLDDYMYRIYAYAIQLILSL